MNIVHVGVSILMLTSANAGAEDTKTPDPSSVEPVKTEVAVFKGKNPVKTQITAPPEPEPEPQPEPEAKPQPRRKNEPSNQRQRVQTAKRARIPQSRVTAIGKQLAAQQGWTGSQWQALHKLWNKESGWNPNARNPHSGAYGIPQALPGRKMRTAGSDWRNNPRTQIKWGISYIKGRYGTPVKAWQHSQAHNWY